MVALNEIKTNRTELRKLKMFSCLGITGAMRAALRAATEALLDVLLFTQDRGPGMCRNVQTEL
jgi:hypothetical protein